MKIINNKSMGQLLNIADIKRLYPDEWILPGNLIMDDNKIDVLEGVPLFHNKDKKEVCYIGRDKTSEPESCLILVHVEIDSKDEIKMNLDTGATHTTIDSNALYLSDMT